MTIPIVHPDPPVVTQTAQTCWACAYESWSRANAAMFGTSSGMTARDLIDLFRRDPRLTFGSTDRASADGIRALSALGLMDMRGYPTSRLRLETLGQALDSGYIYLIYFRVGRPAHAVVLYGADSTNLHVMDPMPGAGLVRLAANHLLTLPRGRAVLGRPMIGDVLRAVGSPRHALSGAVDGAR